jgi:hypothetical protein
MENTKILDNLNTVIEDIRKLQDGSVNFDRHDFEAMAELLNEAYDYIVQVSN